MHNKKFILITGASTGIGRDICEVLASKGETILAGARKEEDLDDLNRIDNVTAVKLDVTKDDDIQKAREYIEKNATKLDVLINNAGIGLWGPLVDIPESMMRQTLEVNLFGVYKVTKAMFSLLHKARGRIINMSSVSGKISPPFIGPYTISKQALESYSDVLRRELGPLGIKVAVIEPTNIGTPIWKKAEDQAEEIKKHVSPLFMEKVEKLISSHAIESGPKNCMPVREVSDAICKAIYSKNPATRYPVVQNKLMFKIFQLFSDKRLDKMFTR